ncbi:type VI secretion system-associated FHA domain protein TagH [Roseateles sp.]|uniref:type VI secretion system-associated FHA domain protein TagH n=1 Tax=Roseateles sp. TaxID=1971397 RepID=UPI003263E131
MIVLCVSSYNGASTEPREASFDELGGTIGRAATNQLVLPDPDRTISRVHAQVVLRNGAFVVIDRGSNAISINGVPLGNGREAPLKPGDKLDIGGYVIQVQKGHQTVAVDPFGDLFGAASRPPAPRAPTPAPVLAPPPTVHKSAPAASSAIPADWDPFAPEVHTSAPGLELMVSTPSDPFGLGGPAQSPMSSGPSLDDLFGLGPIGSAPSDPLGILSAAPPAANTAADSDPLRALMQQPVRAPQVLPADVVSDLHLPWQAASMTPPSVPAPPAPSGAVLSWDESMLDNKVITLPDVRHLDGEPAAATAAIRAPQPAPARPAAPAGDTTALLDALMTGLGLPTTPLQTLTPATMQLVGELLRESTRGAVELLRARAALKQEVRAEVTMIVTQGNNPLKFSPNVDTALNHLLGPTAPGFMTPARAMRDAFDDLRAHEIGVMAGMRAALDGVLARFDPQTLDSTITKRGALASLLPGSRKAQLWEQFQQLYTQLSREAEDDFHALFGKAFLKAYEAQLIALDAEPGPAPSPRR